MNIDSIAILVSLVVTTAFAWCIQRGVASRLRATLDELVHLPSVTGFYVRVFTLCLYFIALGNGISFGYDPKNPPAHFMQYVWPLAQTFVGMLVPTGLYLLFHLLLVTVVVVVLRRRNVE